MSINSFPIRKALLQFRLGCFRREHIRSFIWPHISGMNNPENLTYIITTRNLLYKNILNPALVDGQPALIKDGHVLH